MWSGRWQHIRARPLVRRAQQIVASAARRRAREESRGSSERPSLAAHRSRHEYRTSPLRPFWMCIEGQSVTASVRTCLNGQEQTVKTAQFGTCTEDRELLAEWLKQRKVNTSRWRARACIGSRCGTCLKCFFCY